MGMGSLGPISTPPVIKILIALTAGISLSVALIQAVFTQFDIFPGPQLFLALNWWGIGRGYIWQFITYLFTQPGEISFSSLIYLLINMYLLWVIGTDLVELKGKATFLRFYFFTGIAAGALALLFMTARPYASLAGPGGPLLAMLTVWMMRFPENEILLLFLLPVKTKWIVAGVIAALLLVTLSEWNIPWFILYLSSVLLGYGYAAISWGWQTPFPWTAKLDRELALLGSKMRKLLRRRSKVNSDEKQKSKIIDLQTGKPVSDDELFVENMLAKISKYGENSLSWHEKKRLQQISEKRTKDT